MSVLKYHDRTAWQNAPLAKGPTGPAGPSSVGALLAVQRQEGSNEAYLAHGAGTIWANGNGSQVMRLSYTPTVPVWWDVMGNVGLIYMTTAAYHYRIISLNLNPTDADGIYKQDQYETQRSDVQTYTFAQLQHTFKLNAGTPYTAELYLAFSGGAWQIHQGAAMLNMEGKVYSR